MALSVRSRRQGPGAGVITPGRLAGRLSAWWPRLAWRRILSAQLGLDRGERFLLATRAADGGYLLAATDRALHHRADGSWTRLGWERITAVTWDRAASRLVVASHGGAAPGRTVIPLPRRGTWLELAAERITHTRLASHGVTIGRHRAVVEVRRRPATGELHWVVVCADRTDSSNPELRREIGRAVSRLRADLGITAPPTAAWPDAGYPTAWTERLAKPIR